METPESFNEDYLDAITMFTMPKEGKAKVLNES